MDDIEGLQKRIAELEAGLAYAIGEADGWHDECHGGAVEGPEMEAVRALLGG